MKRSSTLNRHTPLRSKSAPKRRSTKKVVDLAVYAEARRQVAMRSTRCEARIPAVCTGDYEHTHHRLMRSQGGGHDLSNLLAVCSACHTFIHAHPAVSYEYGWLIRSGAST